MKAKLQRIWSKTMGILKRGLTPATVVTPLALLVAELAYATSGNVGSNSFVSSFGCTLLTFFVGDLAVWSFLGVVAGTILIGIVAKIDFAKLISVVVIFGILQGLTVWFTSGDTGTGKVKTALSGCQSLK